MLLTKTPLETPPGLFLCSSSMSVSRLHAVPLFELVWFFFLNATVALSSCLVAHHQSLCYFDREKKKSKLDEFTNDFAKELMEYKKIQKERRRSYSR